MREALVFVPGLEKVRAFDSPDDGNVAAFHKFGVRIVPALRKVGILLGETSMASIERVSWIGWQSYYFHSLFLCVRLSMHTNTHTEIRA